MTFLDQEFRSWSWSWSSRWSWSNSRCTNFVLSRSTVFPLAVFRYAFLTWPLSISGLMTRPSLAFCHRPGWQGRWPRDCATIFAIFRAHEVMRYNLFSMRCRSDWRGLGRWSMIRGCDRLPLTRMLGWWRRPNEFSLPGWGWTSGLLLRSCSTLMGRRWGDGGWALTRFQRWQFGRRQNGSRRRWLELLDVV